MRIELIAYTGQGHEMGLEIARRLSVDGYEARLARADRGQNSCNSWTSRHFATADALVYIGAAGIAVRSIAPHIGNKLTDPAVIVVDAGGSYVIPILSGHVGGANRLAKRISAIIGADAVITTGTDVFGHTAIDEWAVSRGLAIANPGAIVTVSAKLLRGEKATLRSAFPIAGPLPHDLTYADETPDIAIDCRSIEPNGALHLVPPALTLGIGCRRGKTEQAIQEAFAAFMADKGYHPASVGRVASIDLKADEPGLVAFCAERGLPFITYPADALAALPGDFTPSDFVRSATGVDNVCERAAVMAGGTLIVPKTPMGGITMALAVGDYPLSFEESCL